MMEERIVEDGVGKLAGKVAIVTGAGRGIGRAIALAIGGEQARLVVASRTLHEVEETAAALRSMGCQAFAVAADVSNWKSARDLIALAFVQYGGIHILVNNAGVQGPIGPLVQNDVDEWVRTIRVNLIGTFHCCKAAVPYMIQQRCGTIINLSGGGATAHRPHFSAYAASKAAVVRLTETLAEEVIGYNIRVNAVAPGAVNTRMLDEVLSAGASAGEKALSQARLQIETGGTPPELASALVVYLASDESDGLTGKVISALYDGWQDWNSSRIDELMSAPWLEVRRIDDFTLRPFLNKLQGRGNRQ
ncbi:MAG: SDR family oxidoreductase [Chloroflexi bacterium]|nr:SDR family oxidoreductase [Chloroflexota bacterium]